ncbi:MAG TPA: TolC family protein [Arenibacter sp.]|nr:TolC family protein [Arenibacter sp.]
MRQYFLILAFIVPFMATAQEPLTLEACFDLVSKNYPLAKQSALLENQSHLDIAALRKGKLPQLDIHAQATYQSDVTMLPIQIPNAAVTPPNKDQYRATLDVSQVIYNGGLIDAASKVKEVTSKIDRQQVEVDLYALKDQVTQLYVSVLLLQENRNLLMAKDEQIKARIKEVKAGVTYGTLLASAEQALEAERLRIQQQFAELDYNRSDLIHRLSLLIGKELTPDTHFGEPHVFIPGSERERPELQLFDLQKEQIDRSSELISRSKLPQLNAFAQGGYGNPGLNMLENSFDSFYMAGLRLKWNLFDWEKTKTEKQSLEINKDIINARRETFELNNRIELTHLQSEIDKMKVMIATDNEIIALREDILKTSGSLLRNGVITPSAYITEFTNLYEAKSDLNLHQIQLLRNQIQYEITKGSYYDDQF